MGMSKHEGCSASTLNTAFFVPISFAELSGIREGQEALHGLDNSSAFFMEIDNDREKNAK